MVNHIHISKGEISPKDGILISKEDYKMTEKLLANAEQLTNFILDGSLNKEKD